MRSFGLLYLVSATLSRKEVAFGNGKVLLSRLADKIHATSAFCTHYGAPLAKGVLTSEGRVVWYVASVSRAALDDSGLILSPTVHGTQVSHSITL